MVNNENLERFLEVYANMYNTPGLPPAPADHKHTHVCKVRGVKSRYIARYNDDGNLIFICPKCRNAPSTDEIEKALEKLMGKK